MEFMSKGERRQARVLALQIIFCFEQNKNCTSFNRVVDDIVAFDEIDDDNEQNIEKILTEAGKIDKIIKNPTDSPAKLSRRIVDYAKEIANDTAVNLAAIDKKIENFTKEWGAFDRINPIDRNLLRVAVAQMDEKCEVPHKVIINESIEIAKQFGSDDSAKFVNAVLDKIKKEYFE